jgi:phosphate:Na+ symporter
MGTVAWPELLIGLVGGVALFLLGLQQLTKALQVVASEQLRALLLRISGTPVKGALSGVAATGVIQSSTATVLLMVGFTAAGAMTLTQAVAVVLGANVGTTVTIQVIAFDVTGFALLMIAGGVTITTVRRLQQIHGPGRVLLGLGLLFYGMDVMAGAVAPLRDAPAVAEAFSGGTAIAGALLVGAAFTAIVQSSSATAGVLVVLASQGLLDLEVGIAALMGAAIGTCVTPLVAGLATERSGLRVAVVHVLVNIVGVGIWVWAIPQLAALAVAISPGSTDLSGTAQLAADTPRQLANAYTIFKVANLLLFIGFTTRIAALVERLVPDRPASRPLGAIHLDEDVLGAPALALELAERELVRLGEAVREMVDEVVPTVLHGNAEQLDALGDRDQRVDAIYADLLDYLGAIGQQELTPDQGRELLAAISIASTLETIGDVVENNLVPLGHRRLAEGVLSSPRSARTAAAFHASVAEQLRAAVVALEQRDTGLADWILRAKHDLAEQHDRAVTRLTRELRTDAGNRVSSFERSVELVGHLQRIAGLTRVLARNIGGARGVPVGRS